MEKPAPVAEVPQSESGENVGEAKAVSYLSLFRYATPIDWFLMVAGIASAIAFGQVLPAFTLVFGDAIDDLGKLQVIFSTREEYTQEQIDEALKDATDQINFICSIFAYLAAGSLFLSYAMMAFWEYTSVRQTTRMRKELLQAMLRQDIAYFDTQASQGHLLNTFDQSITTIQKGIGNRVGQIVQQFAAFIGAFIIAFYRNWELTLVMLAALPIMALAGYVIAKVSTYAQTAAADAYARAGTIADQNFSKIRTVVASTGEERSIKSYTGELSKPQRVEERAGTIAGSFTGVANATFFWSFALAMWYGSWKIRQSSEEYDCIRNGEPATCVRNDGSWTGGEVMTVLFATLIGSFSLGQGAPHFVFLQRATVAAKNVFDVLDAKPTIDRPETDASRPTHVAKNLTGAISLSNIHFAYPTKPDTPVLRNLSLKIPAGQTVALVGSSGCGKSTVTNLLLRFYDPAEGVVAVDGQDVRDIDLRSLRQQIGLVSQEPRLFACSIRENIAYGRKDATMEDIEAAARAANAHRFIEQLPDGYNTWVGEAGVQLSGGQKQRVAIARAILRNPPILILDEATSALDTQSEKLVQAAIDSMIAGGKRTTIIIAHRLSTIRNADIIAVLRQGEVVETGTHNELIAKNGEYATLVKLQMAAAEVEKEQEEAAVDEDADMAARVSESNIQGRSTKTSSDKGIASFLGTTTRKQTGDGAKTKEEEVAEKPPGLFELLKYNRPEIWYLVLGTVASCAAGSMMPVFAFTMAQMIDAFEIGNFDSISAQKNQAEMWILVLVFAGLGILGVLYLQSLAYTVMGARLTMRIRSMLMRSIMYQEIGWFDDADHSPGILTNRLQSEAASIRGAVGDSLGVMAQNIVTMGAGLIIAFIWAWEVALVVVGTLPVLIVAATVQNKFQYGQDLSNEDGDFSQAVGTVSEALKAIKVVQAFGLQEDVAELFERQAAKPLYVQKRGAHVGGAAFGFSNLVMLGLYGLAFWFGGLMMRKERITFEEFLVAFFSILFAALGATEAQVRFPEVAKAAPAAASVFKVINRKSLIDASSDEGKQLPVIRGDLKFEDVKFAYPSRPDVIVFKHFTLDIPSGKKVALVGESGSGKSTVVSLLERFYDPLGGRVLLDGHDIRSLNLRWLRKQIGLVAQEPALFSASILENIKYGNPEATLDMVEAAAKVANAEEFITQLEEGYNTLVGENGIELSGGQKQRVAIARAVLTDPRILLLDEATSALDARSEAVVQEALDQVMVREGRTTVAIAHRLSTIRNFDTIAVVQKGVIVEQGSHAKLMALPMGNYAALVRVQESRK